MGGKNQFSVVNCRCGAGGAVRMTRALRVLIGAITVFAAFSCFFSQSAYAQRSKQTKNTQASRAREAQRNTGPQSLLTARVRVQKTDTTRGYVEYTGEIITYRRKTVEMMTEGNKKQIFVPERILEMDYKKSFHNTAADMYFDKKQYREALLEYEKALNEERRMPEGSRRPLAELFIWQRLVLCHRTQGNTLEAAQEFLKMLELAPDMTDDVFACIPLAWKPGMGDSLTAERLAKMDKKLYTQVAELLTASYMLSTKDRTQAITTLRKLSKAKDIRLAMLAETQLWRAEERKNITEETLEKWKQTLLRIPLKFCGGPEYVLAEKYAQLEKYDEAALGFLKVATVYGVTDEFAADAMLQAARIMQRGKQPEDAAAILKELLRKFPKTAAAKKAESEK